MARNPVERLGRSRALEDFRMYQTTKDLGQAGAGSALTAKVLLQRLAAGGIVELDRWWIRLDEYGSQVLCRHPHGIDIVLRGFSLETCEFVLNMVTREHSPRSWVRETAVDGSARGKAMRGCFEAGDFQPVFSPTR